MESINSKAGPELLTTSGGLTSPAGSTAALEDKRTPEYLSELLRDKKLIELLKHTLPFSHVERLLEDEITKVRENLFHLNGVTTLPLDLPAPDGESQVHQKKVFVPVEQYPEYNFVGRILGPRGLTAKQLEQDTGCKIMVRGRGSMRDKRKEEQMRGRQNWEHLDEPLHVLIQCEDTSNRSAVKLERAHELVKQLLVPAEEGKDNLKKMQLAILAIENDKFRPVGGKTSPKSVVGTPLITTGGMPEGDDELKKKQLMELAILNGTYRDSKPLNLASAAVGLGAASAAPSAALLNAAAAAAQSSLTPPPGATPTTAVCLPTAVSLASPNFAVQMPNGGPGTSVQFARFPQLSGRLQNAGANPLGLLQPAASQQIDLAALINAQQQGQFYLHHQAPNQEQGPITISASDLPQISNALIQAAQQQQLQQQHLQNFIQQQQQQQAANQFMFQQQVAASQIIGAPQLITGVKDDLPGSQPSSAGPMRVKASSVTGPVLTGYGAAGSTVSPSIRHTPYARP